MDAALHKLLSRLDNLSDQFQELRDGIRKAVNIADEDPEMALTRARKVLEYVVRDIYERRIGKAGTQPLENLLQRLVKEEFFPDRLDAYAAGIRKLGNVGTHKFGAEVKVEDVYQSLAQLMPILEWYFTTERPDSWDTPATSAKQHVVSQMIETGAPASTEVAGSPSGITAGRQVPRNGDSRTSQKRSAAHEVQSKSKRQLLVVCGALAVVALVALALVAVGFFKPTEGDRAVESTEAKSLVSKPPASESTSTTLAPALPKNISAEWLQQVASLTPEEQVAAVSSKMQELNPSFDGTLKHVIDDNIVKEVRFASDHVTNLSPLRALPNLSTVRCPANLESQLRDLTPLKGLPLSIFECQRTQVTDITPLNTRRLLFLDCDGTPLPDLNGLKGMRLKYLYISETKVTDLSPLEGMSLDNLSCRGTRVADLSPLRGMRLKNFNCEDSEVADLSPLVGMPLNTLLCAGSRVTDLSPIRDMPLESIYCDFDPRRDTSLLKSIGSLKKINGKPAAEFWSEMEAAK